MQKLSVIKVIGIGANGESFYKSEIEKADILAGGKRLLDFFENFNCEKVVLGKNLKEQLLYLKKKKDKNIVILASGDPLFFGIGKTLMSVFKKDELCFFPFLNSVQLLCSKIKIPYEDVVNLSIHGREVNAGKIFNTIMRNEKTSILLDRHNNLTILAELLSKFNFKKLEIIVGQMLGTDREKILKVNVDQLKKITPSELDTVLILNKNFNKIIKFGIDNNKYFHKKGLITKKEIRAISLSYLELESDFLLWDIGAGSGSVSIEASYFTINGCVYAIEKEKDRIEQIKQNIKKFSCFNIKTIHGNAPEILKTLPVANRVFIGGNSGGLINILSYLKTILRKGSIVVINLVSIEKVADIINFCKKENINFQSAFVQTNNLKNIGEGFYYKANNGIYIFKLIF